MKKRLTYLFLLISFTASSQLEINLSTCKQESSLESKIDCLKSRVNETIATVFNSKKEENIINAIDTLNFKLNYNLGTNGEIKLINNSLEISEIKDVINEIFILNKVFFQQLKSENGNYFKVDIDHKVQIIKNDSGFIVNNIRYDQNALYNYVKEKAILSTCVKKKTLKKRNACTTQRIVNNVGNKFNKRSLKGISGIQGPVRIFVSFKIDPTGKIKEIAARAPHPKLQEEAIRVIRLLPDFVPATYNGVPVSSMFAIPITLSM